MPKFFFHVREGRIRFEDTQGALFPDLPAAIDWAMQDARAIAGQLALGPNVDDHWMDIGDESGAIVATIPFAQALKP